MKTLRVPNLVALFVTAIALVGQVSAAGAGEDQSEANDQRGRVRLTYTKWVLNGGAGPFMEGIVGGDFEGRFLGEIFELKSSTRVPSLLNRIEAVYQVRAVKPSQSFTALLQGAQNTPRGVALGGKAMLEGFIVTGFRTGAPVHVEFTAREGEEDCTASAPDGARPLCFVGTITIDPVPY